MVWHACQLWWQRGFGFNVVVLVMADRPVDVLRVNGGLSRIFTPRLGAVSTADT